MKTPSRFDVAVALDCYAPYVSGLTESARIIAEGLAGRGRGVAVACTRHDRRLPDHEVINGVHVFRAPVVAAVRKGVLSPGLPLLAARLAARSSLLHLHVPMPEAAVVRWGARRVPTVTTYHIDAFLPPGVLNAFGMRFADASARVALRRSDLVVVNSDDQARGSRLWPVLRTRPVEAIPAPCEERGGGNPTLRETPGLHVGFLGRIADEKGIEYLIRAFRALDDPDARLLIGGDYTNVAGGGNVGLLRHEAGDDGRIRFLGLLRGQAIRDFHASIDVFAPPSIAESFGIVQAEAMMAGVPSVTTDLPGGRHPVMATGFGRVVPPRDPAALLDAILDLARLPAREREQGRDRRVAHGAGHQAEDLPLPGGQRDGRRLLAARDEQPEGAPGDRQRHGGGVAADRPHRRDQAVGADRLGEVGGGAAVDELTHDHRVVVHGEHDGGGLRARVTQMPYHGRGAGARHLDVEQQHVRPGLQGHRDRALPRRRLAHHLHTGVAGEDLRHPFDEQRVVVGEHHPDGGHETVPRHRGSSSCGSCVSGGPGRSSGTRSSGRSSAPRSSGRSSGTTRVTRVPPPAT
ncbi:glycosyltransferase [Sphaerisporangium sp. B11E5]|uniref:glycosyltransferase n=1 Tax=Sphaerisporangium sp. B11E5 TaxID=3153563 RepID=UPI00325E30C5